MGLSRDGVGIGRGQSTEHFQVYAIRERGSGTIVFVGTRIRPADDSDGPEIDAVTALLNAPERSDDLELLVLADHVEDRTESVRIENAVVRAYEAARLTPARSPAVHRVHSAANGSSRGRNGADDAAAGARPDRSSDFLDIGHRQRLEELILRQDREIAELNEALNRVRALRDLEQWADGPGHVRVADLDRALGSTS
ncbi:hypothetical protein ACVBEQ_21205 [Nakamurella sp. GG22]